MKGYNSEGGFLQPVLSSFGLGISIIATLLPLFSKGFVVDLFVNKNIAGPVSFISLVIGIAIIWQVTNEPFININLGKLKDRGRGFAEYWKHFEIREITWALIGCAALFAVSFLAIGLYFKEGNFFAILQATMYLFFFLSLMAIFSMLLAQTRQKFKWDQDRENFPTTLFETLQRNGLVKTGIEILENLQINQEQAREILNTSTPILARRVKVKTISQEEEIIEFLTSYDGKEIINAKKTNEE